MTTLDEIPSVKTAVALEAQRRKRVYLMFLALLLIPVAIGVFAILKAPDDARVMAARVTPIVEEGLTQRVEENVTQRVDRKIEPRVEKLVEERATPVIEQTLNREVQRAVTTRVQPIEQNYNNLARRGDTERRATAARVKELEDRVAALERRLAALTAGPGPRPQVDLQDRPATTYVPKKRPQ